LSAKFSTLQLLEVPDVWRHAVITPVPKCHPIKKFGDLRPISVTSLLCRQFEKLNQDVFVIYI